MGVCCGQRSAKSNALSNASFNFNKEVYGIEIFDFDDEMQMDTKILNCEELSATSISHDVQIQFTKQGLT